MWVNNDLLDDNGTGVQHDHEDVAVLNKHGIWIDYGPLKDLNVTHGNVVKSELKESTTAMIDVYGDEMAAKNSMDEQSSGASEVFNDELRADNFTVTHRVKRNIAEFSLPENIDNAMEGRTRDDGRWIQMRPELDRKIRVVLKQMRDRGNSRNKRYNHNDLNDDYSDEYYDYHRKNYYYD